MRVTCTSCGTPVPASNVNLQNLVAKCDGCDAVFSIADRVGRGGAVAAPKRRPPLPGGLRVEGEPPLPGPEGYRTSPSPGRGELVIHRRWWHWTVLFLTLFSVLWDGFLVFWYSVVPTSGAPLVFDLFPLVHVAAGLAITYWTLCLWLNTTTVRVSGDTLSVRHHPLPWFGNRELPVSSLRQLYLRRKVRRSKNGTSVTWEVHAETEDLAAVKLVSGMRDRAQAEYIEWAIEQHLGIVDDPSMDHV